MSKELNTEIQKNLYDVIKPYQYIGDEYLIKKPDVKEDMTTLVYAFPDKYEIGISNLGVRILYDIVNSEPDLYADRAYAPEKDFAEILEKNNNFLYGVETKKPLKDFDFVGISLQYELAYPTVLRMLKLGGITVERDLRKEDEPIVIAGGPCCFNPKPMSDFIDLFIIGDGEDVIIEILKKYKEINNLPRSEKIRKLAEIDGIYSPLLNNKVKKRIAALSDKNLILSNPVPYSSSVHDRTIIEIRRGCGRMCRFCQPGHVTLPIRERKAEDIINAVVKASALTGYDEYSLLSLSSNDYTNIEPVIEDLTNLLCERKVSVSLPSQRIDRYNERLAKMVRGIRKSTITLAPEAGSQRLRNVINKNLTEEQILSTVLNCYKAGADSIKLYFILGLPTETNEDIEEMAALLSKIRYQSTLIKKEMNLQNPLRLTCTVSVFVPKPFTPFQRHPQDTNSKIKEKITYLLSLTDKIKNVKINYHNPFVSRLEAVLARGGIKTGKFIYELFRDGAYMTSWDENLDYAQWTRIAEQCGIDFENEASKYFEENEELPWDNIDVGIKREWFEQEYQKALRSENTIPCEFGCVNCGVCPSLKTRKVTDSKYCAKTQKCTPDNHENEIPKRYRIKLTKENNLRYLSHLDWQNTIIKSLYRSGLTLNFSRGFNPTPKISLGIALPIFVESETEFVDIEIFDEISNNKLQEVLQNVLPKDVRILKLAQIDRKTPSTDITVQWAEYEFSPIEKNLYDINSLLYDISKKFSSDEAIFTEKKNKKGIKRTINIKPSIKSITERNSRIVMILKAGQDGNIPSLRPDTAISLFLPDIKFRIKRIRFFDDSFKEIDL